MISAIAGYNSIQSTKPKTQHKGFYFRPIMNDTISFTSNNLLTKSSDEISQTIRSSIDDYQNYIGQGTEGKVYKITNTDYCVKIPHNTDSDFGKWNTVIYPQEQVNHIVAKAENKAVIMKHIEGQSLFWGHEPPEIYSIPNNEYKKLLKQLTNAHKQYMVFDSTPANIIYNPKEKTITAVDFYDENSVEPRDFCPLTNVFSCIKAKGHSSEDNSINRKFCGKLLNIVIDEIESERPSEFAITQKDITKMMETLRWSQLNEIPKQFDFLETSMNNMIKLRFSETKSKDQEKQLAGEIKYSKCIIKQILSE